MVIYIKCQYTLWGTEATILTPSLTSWKNSLMSPSVIVIWLLILMKIVHGCLGGRFVFGVRTPVDSAGDFNSSISCWPDSAGVTDGSDRGGVEEAGTSGVLAPPSLLSLSFLSLFSFLLNFSLSTFSEADPPFTLGSDAGLIGAGPGPLDSGTIGILSLLGSAT